MSTVTTASIPENLAELLDRLGDLPPERIRLRPPPGTATEQDLLVRQAGVKRLCELVDGVLVEKPMGFYESRLAAVLIAILEAHARSRNLGIVVGADATMRLEPGLVRLPDVAFVSRGRLPQGAVPHEPIPELAPDLAVEIISPGNTRKEMERKLREYFAAGVRRVWYVYPDTRTVRVLYRPPDQATLLDEGQALEGEDLLPGFSLPIRDWFAQAE